MIWGFLSTHGMGNLHTCTGFDVNYTATQVTYFSGMSLLIH